MMYKRIIDITICILALPILLPFLLIIAVLIKLDSPGPVIYLGIRAGLNGVPFNIYKFRTMIIGADKKGGGTTALNDVRITRIGKILRKFKIDELPQLFNVLKGDMHIVGPRPELLNYTDLYKGEEKLILSVKPGITDYSSIYFSSLDQHVGSINADQVFEEKILAKKNQLRIKYVKEQCLLVDLVIICNTIKTVLIKVFNYYGKINVSS